jgi:hypothetical protein
MLGFLKNKITTQTQRFTQPSPKQEDPNYGLGNITDEQREKFKQKIKFLKNNLPMIIYLNNKLAEDYLKPAEKYSDQQMIESSSKLLDDLEYKLPFITMRLTDLQDDLKELIQLRDAAKKQAPPVTGGSKKVIRKTRKMRRH